MHFRLAGQRILYSSLHDLRETGKIKRRSSNSQMRILSWMIIVSLLVLSSAVILGVSGCQPSPTLPAPNPPAVPDVPVCDISNLPKPQPGAGPINFPADMSMGGTFTGKSGTLNAAIQLSANAQDLIIVVKDDLAINADIRFPLFMDRPHQPSLSITLVSIEGMVTIAPGVFIGGGSAAYGTAGTRQQKAGKGVGGGTIKIVGINIDIKGTIEGNRGGHGGDSNIMGSGPFTAAGNDGGKGGAVKLCALESINIDGSVTAGHGGPGGNASVDISGSAGGVGGSGDAGGDVTIAGSDPNKADVQVFIAGQVAGGNGAIAGGASVSSRVKTNGAPASAVGGNGGQGGSVNFQQAVVVRLGTVAAGNGGKGGMATSQAADGDDAGISGADKGGNATSNAGNGSPPGQTPFIPQTTGFTPGMPGTPGTPGTPGPGGHATAYAGKGGDGNFIHNAKASGVATASGGKNGSGASPGAPVVVGPNAASGKTGGAKATAQQNGAP